MNTITAKIEAGSVTAGSLWRIYTQERIIPMIFKPTGETVYVTLQFQDWIERHSQQPGQAPPQGGKL